MEYKILDGKATSARLRADIARRVKDIVAQGGKRPCLIAVLVGEDPASVAYVSNKEKACQQVGFESKTLRFSAEITQDELIAEIDKLNADYNVDGIIVQLPLPKHINPDAVIAAIDPAKDVDGFHPVSAGKLMLGLPTFLPATPMGIVTLLREYNIPTRGKHCVVIGRSNIVGRPIANMLSQKGEFADCTVTVCHSRTPDIKHFTRDADIIIVAIGRPNFLTADMVKEGAVVIDVGINSVEDPSSERGWKLVGDADFEAVAPKCSYITPVPGGCGPMTIVSLLESTLLAAAKKTSER